MIIRSIGWLVRLIWWFVHKIVRFVRESDSQFANRGLDLKSDGNKAESDGTWKIWFAQLGTKKGSFSAPLSLVVYSTLFPLPIKHRSQSGTWQHHHRKQTAQKHWARRISLKGLLQTGLYLNRLKLRFSYYSILWEGKTPLSGLLLFYKVETTLFIHSTHRNTTRDKFVVIL